MKTTLYTQGGLALGREPLSAPSHGGRFTAVLAFICLLVIVAVDHLRNISLDVVTGLWYGLAVRDQWGATAADRIDWVTDTIKMSLHSNAYAPVQDTDQYFTSATNELATAGGYTAGGQTLTGKTLTYDAPTNTVRLKANGITWTAATFTSRYAVIRKDTGVAGTSHLMGFINFGADQSPAGIDFQVNGDPTDGFLRAVVS